MDDPSCYLDFAFHERFLKPLSISPHFGCGISPGLPFCHSVVCHFGAILSAKIGSDGHTG